MEARTESSCALRAHHGRGLLLVPHTPGTQGPRGREEDPGSWCTAATFSKTEGSAPFSDRVRGAVLLPNPRARVCTCKAPCHSHPPQALPPLLFSLGIMTTIAHSGTIKREKKLENCPFTDTEPMVLIQVLKPSGRARLPQRELHDGVCSEGWRLPCHPV